MKKAICVIKGDGINGVILFTDNGKKTKMDIKITGLKQGKHGMHIHEFGDTRNGCESMGSHFNPFGKNHGGLNTKERHVGDLGNIIADSKGNVNTIINISSIKLRGKYNVMGRSMVIHADEDDLGKGNFPDSKTTGHSGKRVACGIIGYL